MQKYYFRKFSPAKSSFKIKKVILSDETHQTQHNQQLMKNTSVIYLLFAFFLIGFSSIAQDTPPNLKYLIGARASSLDDNLKAQGYAFIETRKSTSDSYQNWWNKRANQCISVRVSNGKVQSIVNAPDADCGKNESKTGRREPGFKGTRKQSPEIGNADLVGQLATKAYVKLDKRGFDETKEVRDGGNTYKLWMNRDGECIKTTSRDGKITSVKASANCR